MPTLDKEQLLSIDRPKPECAECGAPLEPFERHPTRLRVGGDDVQRADFCPDCWEFAKEEAYEAYWVTRRVQKEKRAPKLSRREKAVAVRVLFESLWDQRDREEVDAHLYFLAHLLLRWGGLKWRRSDVDEDGRETIVFENPATGDPIEIRSVDAGERDILEIKQRIEAFLSEYAADADATLE